MMEDRVLSEAIAVLDRSSDKPSTFCQPFLRALPITGAAVSTVGDFLGSETVSASDPLAARMDELQFDLGEGPCWDAMTSARPVLEPLVKREPLRVWPAFSLAIADEPVSSIFAFPLVVGPLRIGAVDLYGAHPVELDRAETDRASLLAAAVGRYVLRNALAADRDYDDPGNAFSRRLVHQATGMVVAQLRIPSQDARLIIQGHAFATDRSMMEVAEEIVHGDLDFANIDEPGEAST